MTYQTAVLQAAHTGQLPHDATDRFRADVARVQRHILRENRTGIFVNLHIPTPRQPRGGK